MFGEMDVEHTTLRYAVKSRNFWATYPKIIEYTYCSWDLCGDLLENID